MTKLQKTLLTIFIMVSLLTVTAIAQPNIVIGGTRGGDINSFEFSVQNTGTAGAFVLPVTYYWSVLRSSWVIVPNDRAQSATSLDVITPTSAGNDYSYIWMKPGDNYVIYTQHVIPTGKQWIAWNAWQWNGNSWVAINSNWNVDQYKID
jgi:hypothetical protein